MTDKKQEKLVKTIVRCPNCTKDVELDLNNVSIDCWELIECPLCNNAFSVKVSVDISQ
jgi:transcription elongation factor Elf1